MPNEAANRKVESTFSTTFENSCAGTRYSVGEYELSHALGLCQMNVSVASPELLAPNIALLLLLWYAQLTAEETERMAKEFAEEKGVKPEVIVNCMRTVVTRQLADASMYDVLHVLMTMGQNKVVQRLRNVDRFLQQETTA